MSAGDDRRVLELQEARSELVASATAAERSNVPAYLLVGASGLLLLSVLFTGHALMQRGGAERELRQARERAEDVRMLAATASELAGTDRREAYAPDPLVASRLEQLGTMAGLSGEIRVSDEQEDRGRRVPGMILKKYSTRVENEESGALMRWLELAVEEVSGLRVFDVQLRPGRGLDTGVRGWNLTVTFHRWERAS